MPRSEGNRLLAATFVHNKFAHRAPEDRALLRCFFAGSNAEDIWQLSDDEIIAVVPKNCNRSSAFAPHLSSPASINGSPPWRNTVSAISNVSTVSNAFASNFQAWFSPATATAASASPTASAPANKPRSKS